MKKNLISARSTAWFDKITGTDDIAITIKGDSLRDLEIKIEICTKILQDWMTQSKQEITINKTKMIVFGQLQTKQKQKCVENTYRGSEHSNILGFKYIHDKLTFTEHIKYITDKTKNIFSMHTY